MKSKFLWKFSIDNLSRFEVDCWSVDVDVVTWRGSLVVLFVAVIRYRLTVSNGGDCGNMLVGIFERINCK